MMLDFENEVKDRTKNAQIIIVGRVKQRVGVSSACGRESELSLGSL